MIFTCLTCGKDLPVIKKGRLFYCSEACRVKKRYMKTKKECLHCGKEFFTFRKNMQKFCSRGCMKTHSNQRRNYIGNVNPLQPYASLGISCKGARV
jgi:DNA-directed RNA polymerase subunit RPC12/RpoP